MSSKILSPLTERSGKAIDEVNRYQELTPLQPRSRKLIGASNREFLMSIQKREMLKGLLINKFKSKYASDKRPTLQLYIDNEINKFLSSDRLTQENLLRLDDKIFKEIEYRDR